MSGSERAGRLTAVGAEVPRPALRPRLRAHAEAWERSRQPAAGQVVGSRAYTPWLGLDVRLAGPTTSLGLDVVDRVRAGLPAAEAWVRRKTGGLSWGREEWTLTLVEALLKAGASADELKGATPVPHGVRLGASSSRRTRMLAVRYGAFGTLRWVAASDPGRGRWTGSACLASANGGAASTRSATGTAADLCSALVRGVMLAHVGAPS